MDLHASDFAKLPDAKLVATVDALAEDEAGELQYNWSFWARPEQRLPDGNWINRLILAGRGTGKTRVGSETVRQWVKRYQYVNLIGATVDDVRTIMVEGESGILATCPDDERPRYIPNKRELHWPNGNKSLLFSAEEPDRLRGKQHGSISRSAANCSTWNITRQARWPRPNIRVTRGKVAVKRSGLPWRGDV